VFLVGAGLHAEEVAEGEPESGAGADVQEAAAGKGASVTGTGVHGGYR